MMQITFTPPSRPFQNQLEKRMPGKGVSVEGYDRRMGMYGEDVEVRRYFPVVITLAQAGIADDPEVLGSLLRSVVKAQRQGASRWRAALVSFDGSGSNVAHEQVLRGDFVFGSSHLKWARVLRECQEGMTCGDTPVVLRELVPEQHQYRLTGRSRIHATDLVLILARKGEVRFDESLRAELVRLRKSVVLCEFDGTEWTATFDDLEAFIGLST